MFLGTALRFATMLVTGIKNSQIDMLVSNDNKQCAVINLKCLVN